MRQTEVRAAAPVNAAPEWPAGYIAVLREAGTKEKTIPYCLGWVRRFFAAYPGRSRRALGRQEIEAFLGSLAAEVKVGAQALPRRGPSAGAATAKATVAPGTGDRAVGGEAGVPAGRSGGVDWPALAEKTRESLRIEHYLCSPRTSVLTSM